MVERLRASPGAFGLVGANGGFQSKYAALVLSTDPAPAHEQLWSEAVQHRPPAPEIAELADGAGSVATYTIVHGREGPTYAIVLGALTDGRRFIARSDDPAVLRAMEARDPLGAQVSLSNDGKSNAFTLAG
jgi:acetyl-CoA C-acetyltransferase